MLVRESEFRFKEETRVSDLENCFCTLAGSSNWQFNERGVFKRARYQYDRKYNDNVCIILKYYTVRSLHFRTTWYCTRYDCCASGCVVYRHAHGAFTEYLVAQSSISSLPNLVVQSSYLVTAKPSTYGFPARAKYLTRSALLN